MNTLRPAKWNVIKSPWFFTALVLFLIHQILQWILEVNIPFVDNYLDPFLFLPIVLGTYLQERRVILKDINYTLDKFRVIGLSIILCLAAEVVFPLMNTGYTFDVFDFVAYGAGAIHFYYKINQ